MLRRILKALDRTALVALVLVVGLAGAAAWAVIASWAGLPPAVAAVLAGLSLVFVLNLVHP